MRAEDAAGQLSTLTNELSEEIEALEKLRSEAADAVRETSEALVKATLELAQVYLPVLDEPHLMAAERRTGTRGFSRRSPLTAMAKEKLRLEHTITSTEADPEWQRRAWLVGPQGSLTAKLKEAADLAQTWERECTRFESLDGFQELVEIGYDTPQFTERWWEGSYWRHWKQGDAICEALGLADFGDDVLPAYEKARAPREQWRAEVKRLEGERDRVLGKVQARDGAVSRLQQLGEIYLAESQKVLAEHLAQADVALLEQWRGEDRAVELLLRRISGLGARRAYFVDLRDGHLATLVHDLGERRRKMLNKVRKYLRPKSYGQQVALPELAVREKLAKIRDRRLATQKINRKVAAFDDFERYAVPDRPTIWWTVWVDSPPPAWTPDWRADVATQEPALRRDDEPIVGTASSGGGFSPLGDIS